VTRFALRLHRSAIVGYAAFFGVFVVIEVISFGSLGNAPADRAGVGETFALLGRQTSYLIDPPRRPELLGGYLQWFLVGFFGMVFSVWALLAGTAAIRLDEEKGLLEEWFSTGVTPARLVLTRLLAFALAAAASMALVMGWAVLLARATARRPSKGHRAAPVSGSSFGLVRTDEKVSRDFPHLADLVDHVDREGAPA